MAHKSKLGASRTSMILSTPTTSFDPQTVEQELIKILNEKSQKFKIGGMSFKYDH